LRDFNTNHPTRFNLKITAALNGSVNGNADEFLMARRTAADQRAISSDGSKRKIPQRSAAVSPNNG